MTNDARKLTIASPALSLDVSTLGAEMQDIRTARGQALLWDGDPAVWAGRAPILFPIVGELAGGRYRVGRDTFAMARHGIARRALFDVVEHDRHSCKLRLEADARTRQAYPFEFRLDVAFEVRDATLTLVATVSNRGDRTMPASFGFHPALRWPLPFGRPRADHSIRFEHPEPAPVRRLDGDGLLLPDAQPTPIVDGVLVLRDELFVDDALILDRPTSRRLRYGASSGPCLDIGFDDLTMLGIWTKPGGAGFICIEPWQGIADPVGYTGDLRDKPGMIAIEAGQSRLFSMTLTLVER